MTTINTTHPAHRFLIRTCAHEATIVHGGGDKKRVDGRNAAELLQTYYGWAQYTFPASEAGAPHHISLGDEIVYKCPKALDLLANRPANTTYLVGNHDYYALNANQTAFPARLAFQNATGSQGVTHFRRFDSAGAIMLNPPYYQEAQIAPGRNFTKGGFDIADASKFRPPSNLDGKIMGHVKGEDLKALLQESNIDLDTLQDFLALRFDKAGRDIPDINQLIFSMLTAPTQSESSQEYCSESISNQIIRNYIPEQDVERMLDTCKANADSIDSWIALGHTPPINSIRHITEETSTKLRLPKKLICTGEAPFGTKSDQNGEYRMIHVREVLKQAAKALGKHTPFIGAFYGNEHPARLEMNEKEQSYVLPAFSRAADNMGLPKPAEGYVLEVVYENGEVRTQPHRIAEIEKEEISLPQQLEATA